MDTDQEGESRSNPTKSEYIEKQHRRDERIERTVEALETGSAALMRASGTFMLWLLRPERPSRLRPYTKFWAKAMAALALLMGVVGEYAYRRAPEVFGAPTIFADPGFMSWYLETLEYAGGFLAIVLGIAWICHQAAWEWNHGYRGRRYLDHVEREQRQSSKSN